MKLTGARILIETLIEQGTDVVFGYPGGSVLNIYDELYLNSDRIKHIITAHEQGAAHAADGYARASGRVGVVLATSGPGATNLVTGIANAYLDSVPMVAVTGNVAHSMFGKDSFQEVDIMGVTLPITKHNYVVGSASELADTVREAFKIAKSGRPGPVLVDIPKDVQLELAEYEPKEVVKPYETVKAEENDIIKAAKLINESKRPFIICGGGAVISGAEEELLALAKKSDAYIGCSMMGLSAVSADEPRNLGMIGMHGRYASIRALKECDLMIALGARFSDRATGDKSKFSKGKKILHIDADSAELNKNIKADLGIQSDLKYALKCLLPLISEAKRDEWASEVKRFKEYEVEHKPPFIGDGLTPYGIIDAISDRTDADMPLATDVGQHQLWTSQRYRVRKPRRYLTSGGLGTMGFGMGAAIGACVATGKHTTLITGDGSFGMNLNETMTMVSQGLPITVVIMNNTVLGNVRQWQTMFYGKRYSSTTLGRAVDFVKLAEAFGAKGLRAYDKKSLDVALDEAYATNGPVIVDCLIDKDERVLPMIPPGQSFEQLLLD